jgi:hypothetical protein
MMPYRIDDHSVIVAANQLKTTDRCGSVELLASRDSDDHAAATTRATSFDKVFSAGVIRFSQPPWCSRSRVMPGRTLS